MLARTDYQHIAGTRCPMDFVEVPSILTEFFAKSPLVLCSFGSHYQTGEALPPALLRKHQSEADSLESLETQNQIQLAILDQLYHSSEGRCREWLGDGWVGSGSSEVMQAVAERVGVFPFAAGTAWQTQFSHLLTYGSSYYSYFWSRKWASRIWNDLFDDKTIGDDEDYSGMIERMGRERWRASGELVKVELLGVGGGRDPFVGLEKVGVLRGDEGDGKITALIEEI
jgi:intermediate peptidase